MDLLSLFLALSPALVAIGVALLSRKVVIALLSGVLTGAIVVTLDELMAGQILSTFETLGRFLGDAVLPGLSAFELDLRGRSDGPVSWIDGDLASLDLSHLVISAFSLAIAAMVGILGRSGGTRALVRGVEVLAKGPRGAQVAAWLSGMIVFFDDYANCLVVGSAMGPVCDRFGVSRAKLAFIVDCTAAPIASIALVSTWVGYEIGLISDELGKLQSDQSALGLFIMALPFAFYAATALTIVGSVAIMGRDFGPMLAAERAARARPAPIDDGAPSRPMHAMAAGIPVVLLISLTLTLLLIDGQRQLALRGDAADATWIEVLSAADPFLALLWSSLISAGVAAILAVLSGGLRVLRLPAAIWAGVKPVFPALTVLFLAWGLGNAMNATQAADQLTELVRPADSFAFSGAEVEVPLTVAGEARRLRLSVVDGSGTVLYREVRSAVGPGEQILRWDGSSSAGAIAPRGRYTVAADAVDQAGEPLEVIVRAEERFPSWLLPAVVFVIAAATAFATGTSFGTLAILIPLVIPLGMTLQGGEPGPVLLGSLAAVLSGAILGDHASPISDTTVLASLGSGIDLLTHVRTQLPYALTAGVIALVAGFIPAGLGVSPWLLLAVSVALTVLAVRIFGSRVALPPAPLIQIDDVDEGIVQLPPARASNYELDRS